MNTTDRRAKIQKYTSLGLIALIGLVVSPIIFLAIKGIIGLAIAALVGLTIVTFTPVISMKFANWRVKAITHEAGENPIETLENLLRAKKAAYARFEQSVVDAVTARSDFALKCDNFSKRYPARATEFSNQLIAMTTVVENMKSALQDAGMALQTGSDKLIEMRAYWEMSQAVQVANKATGMDTGDAFEQLKADTAVDSVFESMNRAFAQLEVAAATSEHNTPSLTHSQPTPFFQGVDVQSKEKVFQL